MFLKGLFGVLSATHVRRRSRAPFAAEGTGVGVEACETRILLSCLPAGTYVDPNSDAEDPDILTVFESPGKKTSGDLYTETIGRFAVKIKCKKNGTIIIKPNTKGVKGKVVMVPFTEGGYDVSFDLTTHDTGDFHETQLVRIM